MIHFSKLKFSEESNSSVLREKDLFKFNNFLSVCGRLRPSPLLICLCFFLFSFDAIKRSSASQPQSLPHSSHPSTASSTRYIFNLIKNKLLFNKVLGIIDIIINPRLKSNGEWLQPLQSLPTCPFHPRLSCKPHSVFLHQASLSHDSTPRHSQVMLMQT